jgi:hypothetical protein
MHARECVSNMVAGRFSKELEESIKTLIIYTTSRQEMHLVYASSIIKVKNKGNTYVSRCEQFLILAGFTAANRLELSSGRRGSTIRRFWYPLP